MKIAAIGALGLPANYGIDRHCEELYSRLANQGHEITVYCRAHYTNGEESFRGIKLRHIKSPELPGWETLLYSLFATVDAVKRKYDIIHYHSATSTAFCWIPRIRKIKVVTTLHSVDWRHSKWGFGAKMVIKWSEWAAVTFSHMLIAVSRSLKKEIEERYSGKVVYYIPNGSAVLNYEPDGGRLKKYGLSPGGYILFVGRLVPEKGIHFLAEASNLLNGQTIVIAGDARNSDEYTDYLRAISGKNVHFIGHISGEELSELYSHASVFVAPSVDEGFGLTVVEAMSHGVCVVSSDIPVYKEILRDAGYYFKTGNVENLVEVIREALNNPQQMEDKINKGLNIIKNEYLWDEIASKTMYVLNTL